MEGLVNGFTGRRILHPAILCLAEKRGERKAKHKLTQSIQEHVLVGIVLFSLVLEFLLSKNI
jgi:hypothetical protein